MNAVQQAELLCTIKCAESQHFTHMQNLMSTLCPDGFELYVLSPTRSRNTFKGKCVWTAHYGKTTYGSIAGKQAFSDASKLFQEVIPFQAKVIQYGRHGGPDFGIFVQYGNKKCNCVQDFSNGLTRFDTELRKTIKLLEGSQPHIIMFMKLNEYDDGVNNFLSDMGDELVDSRFVRVEYGIGGMKLGSTAIGVRTSQGVAIVVVKDVTSPLIEVATVEKIIEVDKHWFAYDEMSFDSCAQAASSLAIQLGNLADNGSNAAILFVGIDDGDPQLWHMDTLGTYTQYDAKVIGSGSERAQQILQEIYTPNMTIQEAVKLSLRTLKEVMEEKLNSTNFEVMIVTPQQLFELYTKEEVQKIIEDLI